MNPHDTLLNCFAQVPGADGRFSQDQVRMIRQFLDPQSTLLMLAFAPKCAGTFIRQALAEIIKPCKLERGSFSTANDERDLYLPSLLLSFMNPNIKLSISHCHTIATEGNRALLELFRIKSVIMLRPLGDICLSLYEMGADHTEENRDRIRDGLVYHHGSWLVKYYASWFDYADPYKHLFLRFEDFKNDNIGVLESILNFYQLAHDIDSIKAGHARAFAEKEHFRFNKGETNRGKMFLTDKHYEHLRSMIRTWGGKDHSETFEGFGMLP